MNNPFQALILFTWNYFCWINFRNRGSNQLRKNNFLELFQASVALIASPDCVACVVSRDRQLLQNRFGESNLVIRPKTTSSIVWKYSWTGDPPEKATHPNKSTVCANNFGTVCTNCPPFSLENKQKRGRRVCAKLFVQTVFIWVGGFLGGSPSLKIFWAN